MRNSEHSQLIEPSSDAYPSLLKIRLGGEAPALRVIGDPALLDGETLGLICSRKCPGSIILKLFALLNTLRSSQMTIVSGFHSPLEQEALKSLSISNAKFVVCPARNIDKMHVSKEQQKLIDDGRMIIVSPFTGLESRQSAKLAATRNIFVSRLASKLLIVHASAGSQTERLAADLAEFFTFDDPNNQNLFDLGAKQFHV